jgi:hypothetical protein
MILTAIIEQRDLESAKKEGLDPEHFGGPRERAGYEFLLRYAEQNEGVVPTRDIFINRSGYTDWVDIPEHIGVKQLAEEIVKLSLARELEQALPDPLELRKDPHAVGRKALEKMKEALAGHGDRSVVPVRLPMRELAERLSSGRAVAKGLPFPWDSLTQASLGLMAQEVSIFYGRPGTMKTWSLLAIVANLMKEMKTIDIMLVSCELPLKTICQRLASVMTGVPYELVRKDEMTVEQKVHLTEVAELLAMGGAGEYANLHLVGPEDVRGSEIQRKVDMVDPDVLFIDSAYMEMDPKIDPEDRKSLTKGIKLMQVMSREHMMPVVATLHAGRKKSEQVGMGGGDDLYGADVVSQRADILYRTHVFIDDDDSQKLMFQISKSREFPLGGLIVKPPPSGSFQELALLRNSAAVEVELLKIGNRGRKPKRITGLDGFSEQTGRKKDED